MKLFTSYTYTWWQIGIFKLALLSIGILIGTHWNDWFGTNMLAVGIVAALATTYITYVSLKQ